MRRRLALSIVLSIFRKIEYDYGISEASLRELDLGTRLESKPLLTLLVTLCGLCVKVWSTWV